MHTMPMSGDLRAPPKERIEAGGRPAGRRGYADLHDHLKRLAAAKLIVRIDAPVNKDTEMHPLVRWQFLGGIPEEDRRAFLFTNIVDSKGRRFDMPVVIGAIAANPEIYRIGMNVPRLEDIGPAWEKAIAHPIAPTIVDSAPVHDIVLTGEALKGPGKGLESLPIPISTPGFDAAPYLTMTGVITKDPETGIQNMGTYRGHVKGPTRLGLMMLANMRSGGREHWARWKEKKQPMPVAIVLGAPPVVAYQGPQKLRLDLDELAVAGGLAGQPINVVKAKTVDLLVPAEAEVVIEGFVDPGYLEPEGPFGESHGYVALEEYNDVVEVSAITRKKDAVIASIISQVTPSESSVVKKLAYEPMFLKTLRDELGIPGLKRVAMHEPLTNLRRVLFLVFAAGTPSSEVWRALYSALTLSAAIGKFVIAVNEDIDPENPDALLWAMAYRCDPAKDTHVVRYRELGHAPRAEDADALESALLIDATLKHPMPPLALPERKYMENARALWERLRLPKLRPHFPWHGYSLGDWSEDWTRMAEEAALSEWMHREGAYRGRGMRGIAPNTPTRMVKENDDG